MTIWSTGYVLLLILADVLTGVVQLCRHHGLLIGLALTPF